MNAKKKYLRPYMFSLGILVFGLFLWHFCAAHLVAQDKLDKLHKGMIWSDAQKIIGESHTIKTQPDGSRFVTIRSWNKWCMLDIEIDSSDRIIYIFHDH